MEKFNLQLAIMNLKLNNESRRAKPEKRSTLTIKEERQRNGRFIAILVGITLFILAIYHAWVRKIPVVASLVVPALIMFIYVGWVLYTASKDKLKMRDAEAALEALEKEEAEIVSASHAGGVDEPVKEDNNNTTNIIIENETKDSDDKLIWKTPIILINDELFDMDTLSIDPKTNAKLKFNALPRRIFRRRFCRSRRHAVYKRSYSIG